MVTLTYIIAAVVLLGLCIFVHELGHLLGGKMVGIKAKTFSMGYGKGFIKKKFGDTTYQVTLIPFGGYCQFYGESPSEDLKGESYEFLSAKPWKRIVTVVMGPLFNLFFGIILFFAMNLIGYDKETNAILIPDYLTSGSSISKAYQAGLRSGDKIISIDGKEISDFAGIQTKVFFSEGKELKINVLRDGIEKTFMVKPVEDEGGRFSIGVIPYGNEIMISGFLQGLDIARTAGLKELDVIKTVDNVKIGNDTNLFIKYVHERPGKKVDIKVKRDGKEKVFSVIPRATQMFTLTRTAEKGKEFHNPIDEMSLRHLVAKARISYNNEIIGSYQSLIDAVKKDDKKGLFTIKLGEKVHKGTLTLAKKIGLIGIHPAINPDMIFTQYKIGDAIVYSFVEPYKFIALNLKGFKMLFSGKLNVRENLSGPIRIAKIAGDVAYYRGLSAFVLLMAKISIILMVMNLLPIPMVDGSHILFFTIEAIRGKPLNQKLMERIQTVGFILLIMLGVFVIINDITMLPFIKDFF